jgi:stage IV sporulation protein B
MVILIKKESHMKKLKKFAIFIFLLLFYIYICNITLLPSSYIMMQGETFQIPMFFGLSLQKNNSNVTLQTASPLNKTKVNEVGKIDLNLSLFQLLTVKNIQVNVIPKTTVVPVGAAIGMKLYTDGVLVVGMSEIEGKKPYENSGIQEGDRIIQINQNDIDNTEDLIQVVNECNGQEIVVKYIREEETITTSMKPVKDGENQYKLGLWVRDAAAGVGTMTFYEPSTKMFATLGHGIFDIDTSDLIKIENGELVTTNILSISKGEKGKPGEIRGTIESGYTIGEISKNTNFGVFGVLTKPSYLSIAEENAIEVCLREEIQTGKAQIICELENGKREYYDIEIQKLFLNNNQDNKSMLIKVTDKRLLEKTGGIIQGMSGAPIIQNGKFVGAVTHVLVNDPTMGYGVFADIMLKQMKEVDY